MHEAGVIQVRTAFYTIHSLYIDCMPALEPKEKLDKVTLLLPKDTTVRLDAMAQKALMGSRGRVVQSLVDSVWDSQIDLQIVFNALAQSQIKPPQKPEEITAWLFQLIFPLTNLVRRFSPYVGLNPVPGQAQPQAQQQAQAPPAKTA
jgi:hypothetical protein